MARMEEVVLAVVEGTEVATVAVAREGVGMAAGMVVGEREEVEMVVETAVGWVEEREGVVTVEDEEGGRGVVGSEEETEGETEGEGAVVDWVVVMVGAETAVAQVAATVAVGMEEGAMGVEGTGVEGTEGVEMATVVG